MRDRRSLLARRDEVMPDTPAAQYDEEKIHAQPHHVEPLPPLTLKDVVARILFLFIVLGVPLIIVSVYTPFFLVERLRCRAVMKFWGDGVVSAMEESYARHLADPPRFPSLDYNRTMLWGTYEPSLLFAMKTRTPRPVYIGLAWYDEAGLRPARHCMSDILSVEPRGAAAAAAAAASGDFSRADVLSDERGESVEVTWPVHDGVYYGREMIVDRANRVTVNVEFLKSPSGTAWHVRLHGQMDNSNSDALTLVVYVVSEAGNDALVAETTADSEPQVRGGFDDIDGQHETFALRLRSSSDSSGSSGSGSEALWDTHGWWDESADILQSGAALRRPPAHAHTYAQRGAWHGPQRGAAPHNVLLFRKVHRTDFRVELSLRHASHLAAPREKVAEDPKAFVADYEALTSCQMTNVFRAREKDVLQRMRRVVAPWAVGFPEHRKFHVNRARTLLSAALGAWGHWYGRYRYANASIDAAWDTEGRAAHAALSLADVRDAPFDAAVSGAVATRIAGAAGARADVVLTGLQLIALAQWNREMAKDTIASWLVGAQDTATGFVPRRAGLTALARGPKSAFASALGGDTYEHRSFAAPPTLLLALRGIIRSGSPGDRDFLAALLPALIRWRAWFHATQRAEPAAAAASGLESLESLGSLAAGGGPAPRYRWHSRDGHRVPASGMPDYPRMVCPGHHVREAHVDLFAWVALLSMTVSDVEEALGLAESVPRGVWRRWLDDVHWDKGRRRYADRAGCPGEPFSPYVGYASVYPLMLGIIDDAERAGEVLALAEAELMTPYGLMSVAYDSVREAREAGLRHDNGWMGHVWISANTIMMHALRTKYIEILGTPAQSLFTRIRRQVVEAAGGVARMPEVFNPVTGAPESTVSLVGHRAMLLAILEMPR